PALAQEQKPVRLLMNWFAQPDQSGFWQAQIDDAGKDKCLKITTTQGGPKIQTIPQVAAGQAEFGVSNADDLLLARLRGAPVRAVFASMDYVPYSLVYHPSPDIKSITDLKQKTFAVSLGFAYWEWLKKQYGLQGAKEIPVSGDLGLFRNDPNMVQQGYSLYLPARMSAAGIANAQFKVAELGYRPYAVLFTTDDLIAKNPGLVRDTVAAVKASWANFVQDPTKALAAEQALNNQIAPDIAALAAKDLIAELLPRDPSKIGCMTDARWDEIGRQLQDVKFLTAEFDVKKAYDKSWVSGC
ncbi:MAG: ABC transporter substrate-binding protein, partial [Xanthobacteraceae bacterium]|nr:ABC transporter substrate-binding protein [Xanthobacteraceae bacterium]